MSTSLSSLVNNLSEIYKKECKGCMEKKSGQNAILLGLKIINYTTNVKNAKKNMLKVSKWINERFPKFVSILQWWP